MRKNPTAMLLALALTVGLLACAGSGAPAPEGTAAPAVTGTPVITRPPETGETAVPADMTGRVTVEMKTRSETVFTEEGDTRLLEFSSTLPVVTIQGREAAAAAVNSALEKEDTLFAEGVPDQEQMSGRERYLEEARNELEMRLSEGYPDYFHSYELVRTAHVTRGDGRVLSFAFAETTYAGGAHGYNGLYGINFDTRTGAELRLGDLAEDEEAFLTACAEQIRTLSRDADHAVYVQGYYPDYEDALPALLRDGNWYFDANGLTVIANPYEIAPYAAGRIEFTLPYEWLRRQIREEYIPSAGDIDGTLTGRIAEGTENALLTIEDGTDGQGACVEFTADGIIRDVTVFRVEYAEYSDSFMEGESLAFLSVLNRGESFAVRTWIPDAMPSLAIRYTDASGEKTFLISQSGKDGSLVLMDMNAFLLLPVEISQRLPIDYDLDNDGERETIDLVRSPEEDGRWSLTVNGFPVGDALAMDGSVSSLWLTDLDYDNVAEILFSGDMGSEDYVTCAWRGDTLEPIAFTGESRMGADPSQMTNTVNGRVVISGWQLYLESWSYQLGTYRAIRAYTMENGVIAPANGTDWTYDSNTMELTVKKDLPVILDGGEETHLSPGTSIRLLGTDGDHVRFTAGEGVSGTITLELIRGENSGWTIAGVSENEYFEMLPYVG